jgi:2-hydroxy-3-oxopropionate reductase
MSTKIALIGAGVMGNAIGTRLLEVGNHLSVYDRNQSKVDALVDKGATAATSPALAAATADYIILSLNNAAIVSTAVFGQSGVAEQARSGAQIIDMSSIDPISTRELAAKAQSKGLRWLDCPLSGGAPKALTGNLTVMAGGDEADFNAASIVMDQLCANFTLMGPVGAGQTTKLINQVLCGLNFVAVAEATQLAIDAGVDASKIPQALKGGRADSAILQEFMAKMAAKDYSPTGRIDNMVKDLNGVQDLARSTNTAMPLTAVCAEIHRHLMHSGFGGDDNAALMKFYASDEE